MHWIRRQFLLRTDTLTVPGVNIEKEVPERIVPGPLGKGAYRYQLMKFVEKWGQIVLPVCHKLTESNSGRETLKSRGTISRQKAGDTTRFEPSLYPVVQFLSLVPLSRRDSKIPWYFFREISLPVPREF